MAAPAAILGTPSARSDAASVATTPQFRGHIPELDSIRAVGIFLVVCAHTWPVDWVKSTKALQTAWMAMDSFFVLSGFLIAGILLDMKDRKDYFKSFYVRRALRILPAYYLMLAGVTIYVYLHRAAFAEMFGTWGSPGWFFVYMGNLPSALYGRFPGGTGDLFNPLWSLQIEEQFYLLFPMCVRFLSTPALKRFLWAAVILSPCLRLLGYFWDPTNWVSAYVLLPCRMEGLALGSLIALRFREGAWPISRKKISVLTVFWLAAASIFTVSNGVVLQQPSIRILGYTISSIAGAHLVMWLISFRGTKLTTCLRSKPIQHMGLISYGLYLLHMPVALMLKLTVGPLLGIDLSGGVPRLVAVMATTIGLASLSWYWVESPAVKLKDRWFPRRA